MDLHNITALELAEKAGREQDLLDEVCSKLSGLLGKAKSSNIFISFDDGQLESEKESLKKKLSQGKELPLLGVPAAFADNICSQNFKTTCASKMLSHYQPPFNAQAIELLRQKGAIIAGKTNMEEFGLGCSGGSSHYGTAKNPWAEDRIAGSGAAAAAAISPAMLAYASDTTGELRQSAAYCGVIAIRPSYGRISRRGVVDYASSMEQLGAAARSTADLAAALEAAAGPDQRDPTSLKNEAPDFSALLENGKETLKAAVPAAWDQAPELEDEVKDCFNSELENLKAAGIEVELVELEHFNEAYLAAAAISSVEAFSNLANYDGVRFGYRGSADSLQEMYAATRSEGFSSKLRQFLTFGAMLSSEKYYDKYYLKSQRLRTRVKQELEECLKNFDLLLTPTVPFTAPAAGGKLDKFQLPDPAAFYTAPPSLAGLPSLTFPALTSSGLPAGLQFIGRIEDEGILLKVSLLLEKERSPLKYPEPGSM